MDIRPEYANKITGEKEEKVEPDNVEIGDKILIKPGEKVPLNGIVIEGNFMLDTKTLTGESIPRKTEKRNKNLNGYINQNGLLKVKISKEFDDPTVNKILELVENASNKKLKSENFIKKFAKYYTPIDVVIAQFLQPYHQFVRRFYGEFFKLAIQSIIIFSCITPICSSYIYTFNFFLRYRRRIKERCFNKRWKLFRNA